MTLNRIVLIPLTTVAVALSSARATDAPPIMAADSVVLPAQEEKNPKGTSIPEPAAALLAILGFAWLLRRR